MEENIKNETLQVEEPVTETTETTSTEETKPLTENEIDQLSQIIHAQAYKKEMLRQTESIQDKVNELKGTIKGLDMDKEFIDEMLKSYTVEQLESRLKNDDAVEAFFINPETGEPLEMNIEFESKAREIEFKRGLLVYIKSSQDTFEKIDKAMEELDKETEEFQKNIGEVTYSLSDNVLTYINYMKDRLNLMEEGRDKRHMTKLVKYLESGFTFEVFADVIKKYPTVAPKCISELKNEQNIKNIGARYGAKLKTNKIPVSLIGFASDITEGRKSLEELLLIRGEQYIIPDLFIYSLIRFFAMEDWNDGYVRKLHASVSLTLKKLLNNEFTEEVKNDVINSMVDYLKLFPTE